VPDSAIDLPCYVARPTAPTTRGVIVIHEGMGINTNVLHLCERLAAEGYVGLAPNLFFRTGDAKDGDWWGPIEAITPEQLRADLETAIARLRAEGVTSVGVTGFCMGGNFSYAAARRANELGIKASVPFYGSRIVDDLGELQCPTIIFFAGDDEFVPADDVAAVQAHHGHIVTVYPDAKHSFMNEDGATYHPGAFADAWAKMLAHFDEHLR
jgi:carboxymethylenebutenolidase